MIEEILERSINRALALDALSRDKMQQLAGKIIALEIEDLNRIIQLVPDKDSVQVRQWSEQPPDVTICGRFSDYLRGAAATLRNASQPNSALRISGDAETLEQLRTVLVSLDLEEVVSQVVGDTAARKLMIGLKDITDWLNQAGDSIAANIGEVLKEEKRLLATGPRHERFLNEVTRLQESTDRLEVRVDRLERGTTGD